MITIDERQIHLQAHAATKRGSGVSEKDMVDCEGH
jgi:hypothetical protein